VIENMISGSLIMFLLMSKIKLARYILVPNLPKASANIARLLSRD